MTTPSSPSSGPEAVIIHDLGEGIWVALTASPIVAPALAVLVVSALIRG